MSDECRECRAGRAQALQFDLAWHCPEHGTQRLDVAALLTELEQLRTAAQIYLDALASYPHDGKMIAARGRLATHARRPR